MASKTATKLAGESVRDFSGGPNRRDSGAELAKNESVDAWNCTGDERGGVSSRLGMAKYNPAVYDAAALCLNGYKWRGGSKKIIQAGKSLYVDTSTTSVQTFSTADVCAFAELGGELVVLHPVDGLYTSTDAATFTKVADPDAPTSGTCLAVWDNKLFVGGIAEAQVQWSNAGDPTAWTNTDFVQLRSIDEQPIVNLEVSPGWDIQGRGGLLAFKKTSAYIINDSGTGAYETIDASVGAAGPKAVVTVNGKVFAVSQKGVYAWQQGQVGMVSVSDRLAPLWTVDGLNEAHLDLFCAGRKGNRARFSICRNGSSVNDLALEFHTIQGWMYPHSNPATFYLLDEDDTEVLYAGSPSVNGQVYELDAGGTDDGTAITGWFQTRWFELNQGFQAQLWQTRLHGRGSGNVTCRTDYMDAGGTTQQFSLTDATQPTWNNTTWGGSTWAISSSQQTQEIDWMTTCRQFSLRFDFTVSTTTSLPAVFSGGVQPTVGAFGLLGFEFMYVNLGIS